MTSTPLPGFDQLYDAAPCGHIVAAVGGSILQVNATFCRWVQQDAGELREQRLPDLFTTGGRIFFHTHLQPLLRMQSSVSEVKLEVRRKDGGTLPMLLNIVEQTWQGTRLHHVSAFIAEDRHKYERELILQRQRAEQLLAQHEQDQRDLSVARAQAEDRALFAEQLVGIVSHDIRNPLSVIQMSTVLLERWGLTEQQRTAVARVGRAAGRVHHLIADLLDFSQARLGQGMRVRRERVDLHAAVADSVAELAVAFPDRVIVHEATGEGWCHADAERLGQAIGNLVANAVNHGAPDSQVTVRTAGSDGQFEASVHNDGQPISPALIPNLFEPMVRGPEAGAAEGVGLGLFIVREIARAHGGSVRVESTPAAGTTFTIALPCG